jgi:hypothetical protein
VALPSLIEENVYRLGLARAAIDTGYPYLIYFPYLPERDGKVVGYLSVISVIVRLKILGGGRRGGKVVVLVVEQL